MPARRPTTNGSGCFAGANNLGGVDSDRTLEGKAPKDQDVGVRDYMARELKNQSFYANGTCDAPVSGFSHGKKCTPPKTHPRLLEPIVSRQNTPPVKTSSPHHRLGIRMRTTADERAGKPRCQQNAPLTNVDLRRKEPAVQSPESGPVSHFKIPSSSVKMASPKTACPKYMLQTSLGVDPEKATRSGIPLADLPNRRNDGELLESRRCPLRLASGGPTKATFHLNNRFTFHQKRENHGRQTSDEKPKTVRAIA